MDDLIERLEKATGPDRILDGAIWDAIGHQGGFPAEFTGSIDAALTLVPEGWKWELSSSQPQVWMCEQGYNEDTYNGCTADGSAKTPAIALCIAALKARKAVGNSQ